MKGLLVAAFFSLLVASLARPQSPLNEVLLRIKRIKPEVDPLGVSGDTEDDELPRKKRTLPEIDPNGAHNDPPKLLRK